MKNSYNKLVKLNLINRAKKSNFNEFSKLIIDKDILQTVNTFLERTRAICEQLKINNREYLTIHLLFFFWKEIVPEKEVTQLDTYMYHTCEEFIKIQKFDLIKIIFILFKFKKTFDLWKFNDQNRLLHALIISFANKRKHLDEIHSKDTCENQKDNMITEIESQIDDIKQLIIKTDHNFDLKYLEENYDKIIEQIANDFNNISNKISDTFKQTFIDFINQEFIKNKNIIDNHLIDITKRLHQLSSDDDKIILDSLIKTNNYEHIFKLFVRIIFKYEAPIDNKDTNEVIVIIDNAFQTNKWKNVVGEIIYLLNTRIDKIYLRIKKLKN
jgi:hypothetical protein